MGYKITNLGSSEDLITPYRNRVELAWQLEASNQSRLPLMARTQETKNSQINIWRGERGEKTKWLLELSSSFLGLNENES